MARVVTLKEVSLFIYVITLTTEVVGGDEQEYRLTRYLLANYDASVRPTTNSSQALTVIFGVSLRSIIDVDERNQILTTNCWLTQIWTDVHLSWNNSDFGGIHVIRIPFQRVWLPDIILYNNADSQYSVSAINTNVIVTSEGLVTWLTHGIYRSSCDMNVEYFPFDMQACKMMWASWTYDGYQLDLVKQTEAGDITNYLTNGEFDLVEFSAIKNISYYSCCAEPYPDITYTIKIRRRPMFYVFNFVLPCLLINGIALLVFYVPCESGEKVTLGISSVLSMTVFLMTIRESLPPTEKTPLISLYYGVTICLVSLASALSVVTLNLHHRGVRGAEVPRGLHKLVVGPLSRLLLLHLQPTTTTTISTVSPHDNNVLLNDTLLQNPRLQDPRLQNPRPHNLRPQDARLRDPRLQDLRLQDSRLQDLRLQDLQRGRRGRSAPCFDKLHLVNLDSGEDVTLQHILNPRWLADPPTPTTAPTTAPTTTPAPVHASELEQQLVRLLDKVCTAIEKTELRQLEQDRQEVTRLEWQQVALVVDRFLLACFLLFTIIASASILLSSPHGP